MADSDKDPPASTTPVTTPGKAAEPPKPVHIGGESFVDRVLPHIKKIALVCVGISVVVAIFFGIRAFKQRGQKKDTTALAEVLDVASRDLRGSGSADPNTPTFVDTKERAAAALDTITKQGGGELAGPAFRAGLLLDMGKYDEAITEYKTCETAPELDGVLCREGLALAIEAKATDPAQKDNAARNKGLEDALVAFKDMQPDDEGLRAAYAHYHQGRILLLLNKRPEAKTAFEKAKELAKDTADLPDLIEKRLAGLGA